MSYNIEKKNDQFICRNSEIYSPTYIFELIFKDKFNNVKIIRGTKNSNSGTLLSNKDNILYTSIKKYKLTIFNINSFNKPIIIKQYIDHSLTTNTYLVHNIYLEINKGINDMIKFNYHLIFN